MNLGTLNRQQCSLPDARDLKERSHVDSAQRASEGFGHDCPHALVLAGLLEAS